MGYFVGKPVGFTVGMRVELLGAGEGNFEGVAVDFTVGRAVDAEGLKLLGFTVVCTELGSIVGALEEEVGRYVDLVGRLVVLVGRLVNIIGTTLEGLKLDGKTVESAVGSLVLGTAEGSLVLGSAVGSLVLGTAEGAVGEFEVLDGIIVGFKLDG